jgi:shikimate dehydrogenase
VTLPYAEVIGDPIAHSKSPAIHRFWLGKLGLSADYRACHVTAADLAGYLAARRRDPLWRGCNVTVPHKLAALALADRCDGAAEAIGAANLLVSAPDGALEASNTDAAGFLEPIADLPLASRHAAVIGAGGASRAVLAALAGREIGLVTILNRSPEKAVALLARFGLAGEAVPLGVLLAPSCALLVNASSLGMAGQPPLEVDLAPLPGDAVVYDIVYAPLETGLLAAARARGLRAVDGLAMLIGQAAVAFERFFGQPPRREHDAELRSVLTS